MTDAIDRIRSALASRYAIERQLGAGGMATVYLARDLKHDRDVALKVLRPELAAVLGAERFTQEIRITANLNHPHILPLLDSGSAEEQLSDRPPVRPPAYLYYVMPCIEGDTLRDRMNREKQLSVEDSLEITKQVASALEYAHRKDVIHRDIKPENILFNEGVAMVADFGIALAVKSAGGDRLTETGMSLGTPAYMSPEQVAGDRDFDGRSDIYSLACVLYEMLAGDPPFVASNPQAILAKHVTDPAPPITTVRSSVPQPVASAIAKALGKARADRFESAKEFSAALFAETTDAGAAVKSIVVLPLENLSPDPENEYFSDGLTEEVISDLSKVRALDVISRSSAMTFKGSNKRVPEIARELNVRYVLEGSVRKAANSLRITAQLIDAERDVHLWADKHTGTLDDVFDMQEQVSKAIVDALKVTLTPGEQRIVADRPIDNVAAYECYLRAKTDSFEFNEGKIRGSIKHLEDGLQLIGDNALLHAGMAFAHMQLANIGAGHEDSLAKAHEFAEKAMAADPQCAEAYTALAWTVMLENDVPGMARYSKLALEIDPTNTLALGTLGSAYLYSGHASAAAPVLDRLKRLDPIAFQTHYTQGALAFYDGRFARAAELWRILYEGYGFSAYAPFSYGIALIYHGDIKAANELFEANAEAHPGNAIAKVGQVMKHAALGDTPGVYEQFDPDFVKTLERDYTFAHHIAGAFAVLGETDEALQWLETAVAAGFINYPMLAEHDPFLKNIRGDERFEQLMVRVKKEWEEFEI